MASYNELSFDWNILCQEYDQWTKSDLQLAAELGKTLLERNKELENTLKQHQSVIDDQAQEIMYLQKQTAALREVNDSRLKIYEQLEVGIHDLERANHRLIVENTTDKKQIKSLTLTIETLEARTDELGKSLEDAKRALAVEKRKNERLQEQNNAEQKQQTVKLRSNQDTVSKDEVGNSNETYDPNTTGPENCSFAFQSPRGPRNANSTGLSSSMGLNESLDISNVNTDEENEEIIRVVTDLETTKKALMAEQQRVTELEEQLVAIIQENQTLQGRLAQSGTNDEMKSMHEELSILDEVRQGNMCSRCLRSVDDRVTVHDEASSIAPTEDDDDRSLMMELENAGVGGGGGGDDGTTAFRSAVSIKVSPHSLDLNLNAPASPNPYRDLVEKYEALLEVQRHSVARKTGMSLAEEFQTSGDYSTLRPRDNQQKGQSINDGASSCNGSVNNESGHGQGKSSRRTPTEFSEAETSSSGFSDETSNKGTQTDDRPGYFLCSIGDGEDCKFSIYDDASPIDSRFRNRPEYRELFKEIFAVLKKAAENKEEGEKLPLLDDQHPPVAVASKVPPVTPANEELPDFGDDTQSIISSAVSEMSFAMSECITKTERKSAKKHIIEKNQENKPPSASTAHIGPGTPTGSKIVENGRVLTPLKREPLEYLSVGVAVKKKNRRKNRNFSNDRSDSPVLPSPPRVLLGSGKKRRDYRPLEQTPIAAEQPSRRHRRPNHEWNGSSLIIYNRTMQSSGSSSSPNSPQLDMNSVAYRPSTVSQDLHKLKKLDLSYAEVLRRADVCQHHRRK